MTQPRVENLWVPFDPQPQPSAIPRHMPSPFSHEAPPSLCRRAAEALQSELDRLPFRHELHRDHSGKMFCVLIGRDRDGRVGTLRAFSGMLGGSWHQPGFAGPLFDLEQRDRFWPAGEATLVDFESRIASLRARRDAALTALKVLDDAHHATRRSVLAEHEQRRRQRHSARRLIGDEPGSLDRESLRALADESRRDKARRRSLRDRHHQLRDPLTRDLDDLEAQLQTTARTQRDLSNQLLGQVQDTYEVVNGRGQRARLGDLFARTPPGGTGDCAAPKALGAAYRLGIVPLALCEFWWGSPPTTGGRVSGHFYPACRGKCGPLLSFMLQGYEVAPAPEFGRTHGPPAPLAILYEDAFVVAIDKPPGLLSVPGRAPALRDSVASRLRTRYPQTRGPGLVHRLDLDASGVLLFARDPETHRRLHKLFASRSIRKRYEAIVEGSVSAGCGEITLPVRGDPDDRPRQIVDVLGGKAATTRWQRIGEEPLGVRMRLEPITGRTHQLRVHAAHPDGLNAPIVGDRLYGSCGPRLHLHATSVSFDHPHTGQRLEIVSPAPF